ncbi:MAG: hypothetical protein ACOYXU_02050, partial [Nitrospirota bacterium]
MTSAHEAIEAAIAEAERALARVRKGKSRQVKTVDEIDYLKSVAYSWFRSYRPKIEPFVAATALASIDGVFRTLMDSTAKSAARSTHLATLKDAKVALVELRSSNLVPPAPGRSSRPDVAPDFSALATDGEMQRILSRRWDECQLCLRAGAHLAATVMMGGLLEALFVARANQMADKSPLFRAKTTPIDGKTKKPLQLTEWTLRPYIEVGAELGWISKPGKDVAAVLRDYRNYVHPEKERT